MTGIELTMWFLFQLGDSNKVTRPIVWRPVDMYRLQLSAELLWQYQPKTDLSSSFSFNFGFGSFEKKTATCLSFEGLLTDLLLEGNLK